MFSCEIHNFPTTVKLLVKFLQITNSDYNTLLVMLKCFLILTVSYPTPIPIRYQVENKRNVYIGL